MLSRQAPTGSQLLLDLPGRIGPLVIDGLIAHLEVDIEFALADIDTDIEDLIELDSRSHLSRFLTGFSFSDADVVLTSLRVLWDTSEYLKEKPSLFAPKSM